MDLTGHLRELRTNVLAVLKLTQRPIEQLAPSELNQHVAAVNQHIKAINGMTSGTNNNSRIYSFIMCGVRWSWRDCYRGVASRSGLLLLVNATALAAVVVSRGSFSKLDCLSSPRSKEDDDLCYRNYSGVSALRVEQARRITVSGREERGYNSDAIFMRIVTPSRTSDTIVGRTSYQTVPRRVQSSR